MHPDTLGQPVVIPATAVSAHIEPRTTVPQYQGDRPWNVVDYTTLSAVDRCNRWGIIRHVHHKTFPATGRSMALEAGSAVHDAVNAARLFQLWKQGHSDHMEAHGPRVFGNDMDRWLAIREYMTRERVEADGEDECRRNAALEALQNSGFIDHPNDNRRTMDNLQQSVLSLMDFMDWERENVWVSDPSDPSSAVGIEMRFAFDIQRFSHDDDWWLPEVTYIGAIDGINEIDGTLVLQEHKTTWRVNEPWRQQFELTHQVTGYAIGSAIATQREVTDVEVVGVSVPPPKRSGNTGIDIVSTDREDWRLTDFLQWVHENMEAIAAHHDDPVSAPMDTNSCARFNQSCPLIPLCAQRYEDRKDTFENEMSTDGWNVLEGVTTLDG